MAQPKVLVGCPTYDGGEPVLEKYVNALKGLDYDNGTVLLVDTSKDEKYFEKLKKMGIPCLRLKGDYIEDSKQRISEARNILREYALKRNFDYFMSLEHDLIAPKNLLNQLLSHNENLVSAYYGKRKKLTVKDNKSGEIKKVVIDLPKAFLKAGSGKIVQANAYQLIEPKKLVEVAISGLGCMLISKEVLQEVAFRTDNGRADFINFCLDARKFGHKVFVDGTIIVPHLHKNNDPKKSK